MSFLISAIKFPQPPRLKRAREGLSIFMVSACRRQVVSPALAGLEIRI
jgi:hypothetical protein